LEQLEEGALGMGKRLGTWSAAALVFAVVGCKEKPPAMVPVNGKVVDKSGKPLVEKVLTFHPQDESNKNTRPSALTNKEGGFSTTCAKGRYKITVATPPKGPPGGGPTGGFTPGVDVGKDNPYRDPQKTPLSIDVPETGKDNIVLTVKGL
jgi:hypothetical protein